MKEVVRRSECPVSFCLDFLGDKWSFLILRDMIFDGKTSFGEFLESPEGIATNILTARLKMLEAEGFIFRYPLDGKVRTGYCLTRKAIELIPIIVEMLLWGVKYGQTNPRREQINALKKDKEGVIDRLTEKLLKRTRDTQKQL